MECEVERVLGGRRGGGVITLCFLGGKRIRIRMWMGLICLCDVSF